MKDPNIKFRGIYWNKAMQQYAAQFKTNGKTTYLGASETQEEAAMKYDDGIWDAYKKGVIKEIRYFAFNFGNPDLPETKNKRAAIWATIPIPVILETDPNTRKKRTKTNMTETDPQYPGITWNTERKKWKASIQTNGKKEFIGAYNNLEDAKNAYRKYLKKLIIKFPQSNRFKTRLEAYNNTASTELDAYLESLDLDNVLSEQRLLSNSSPFADNISDLDSFFNLDLHEELNFSPPLAPSSPTMLFRATSIKSSSNNHPEKKRVRYTL